MKAIYFSMLLLFASAALAQNTTRRDTVRPDTTQLVPIKVAPPDTPPHHNMPVIDPTTQDSLQMKKENPKREED